FLKRLGASFGVGFDASLGHLDVVTQARECSDAQLLSCDFVCPAWFEIVRNGIVASLSDTTVRLRSSAVHNVSKSDFLSFSRNFEEEPDNRSRSYVLMIARASTSTRLAVRAKAAAL
ncbi:MAG: hypothetical protein Q9198_009655, partial [Flavoplaca austrocitrina]